MRQLLRNSAQLALILITLCATEARSVEIGATVLLLELVVNDVPTGEVATVVRTADGDWTMSRDDLDAVRIDVRGATGTDAQVRLSTVPGLAVQYDEAQQRLALTLGASHRTTYHIARDTAEAAVADDARGWLVNYDINAERGNDYTGYRAFLEQRAYAGRDVLWNTGIVSDSDGYRRLQTVWQRTFIEHLTMLSTGDIVTRTQGGNRAVRMLGMQFARNFAPAPGLVTRPLPLLSGIADTPSTVDLYINNVRQLSSPVPAGPFVIEQPPSLVGAGQAAIVVTDLLGRRRIETLDLYIPGQMLSAGLSDYSLSAGRVRKGFATDSDSYVNGPAIAANWRYGVRSNLTLELQAEAHRDLANVGGGLLATVGRFGQVNASLSLNDDRTGGRAGALGYRFQHRRFSASADVFASSKGYRDLASQTGGGVVRRRLRILGSAALNQRAAINASLIDVRRGSQPVTPSDGPTIDRSRIVSVGIRQAVGTNALISVNALRDIGAGGNSIFVSLSWHAGRRTRMQVDADHDDGALRAALSASRRRENRTGLSWRARQSIGRNDALTIDADYSASRVEASLALRNTGDTAALRAGLRGSLVYDEGALVSGRRINGAFALVSTSGVADVPVYHEGRLVGHTDAGGRLVVDQVSAYQKNRIAIEPLAVSFDYQLGATEHAAVPADNAGSHVRFDLSAPTRVLVKLTTGSDGAIPMGATVSRDGRRLATTVGYDGLLLLDHALLGETIDVRWRDRVCSARLPAATSNANTHIPVACR